MQEACKILVFVTGGDIFLLNEGVSSPQVNHGSSLWKPRDKVVVPLNLRTIHLSRNRWD